MNQSSNACAGGGTRTRIPLSLLDDNVARAVDLRFAGRKKNSNWDEKTSLKPSVGLECRGRARVDQNNAISENSKIHAVTIEKCGGDTGAAPISNIPSNATRDIASKFVSKVFDESQSAVRFMYGGRVAHGGVMDAEVSDRAIGVGSNSMTVSNCEIPQFELRSSKYYDRENLIGDDDIVKGRGGELQACKGKTTDDYDAECHERIAKLSTSPKAQLICHEHDHNHDQSDMLISTNVDIASNDSEFYPTTKSIETIAESEGTIKKYHAPNCNQVGKHRTEVPTAVLGHCRQRLWLDFGDDSLNEVGKTTSIPFRITATSSFTSTTSILIDFDRIPFEKGVDLFIGESLPEAITDASTLQTVKNSDLIEPIQLIQGESRTLHVLWTPVEMGAMREVIHLNLQSAKLEIFLNGIARNPRQRLGRESSHDEDLGNNAKLQEKVHTAKALHMKTFSKHESSAGTNILNVEESGIHVMPVTTTEFNAYNTYGDARWEQNCSNTFQCWLNDLFSYHDARNVSDNFDPNEEWNKAIFLFNSPEMKAARYTIETSVKSGRLAIKSDRNVMSNIDVQKKLTDLILSYSTRWLQLGLEIVLLFHDDRTHMKITKKSLKNLISQRLLSEPSTVLKYTGGRCKTPSGKFERELGENLQCHALTKILLLVVFLDRAKEERILGKDPCLFIKSSSLKSSKQVLESVSKECMGVEGLIIKHLERYGILLSHVQHPLDEYDLAIANLAVDLKDGVRLAKMVQLLSYNPDILSVMRIPADSRELRIHNIGIVLKVLRGLGVPNISDITSTHIVDGHRPRILQLLWATISHFRLSSVLQSSTIVREIERIKLQQVSEDIYFSSEKLTGGLRHGEEGEEERTAALLLEWSQMICSQYGISVKDLTNSFTDGTAFCSLIHFYHPMLVPRKEFLAAKSNAKTIPSALATDGSFHPETRKNENRNLSLAKACVSKLGGIPELFAEIDPFHPQREKSLIIGITYLFSRLTETREEVIAAISIQKWYRRTRRLAEFKQKISSAQLILNGWRKHKKLYFRNVRTKYGESLRHIDSTYTASYKGRELVNRIITLTSSVVCIQSFFRGRRARREYRSLLSEREAAFLTMIRRRDLEDKSSILIQGKWRCFKAITTFRFLRKVIVLLQALHRCYLQKVAYRNVLVGVVKIQANWRSFRFYKEYTRQLKMIINLQAEIRKFNARKSMIQQAVNKKKKSIFHSRYLAWRCGRTSHSRFSGTVTTLLSKDGNNTNETLSSFPDREQCFFCITPFLVYLNEFRSFKEGQRIQEYASIQIQRAFRVFIEKRRYRVMRNASIEIQRFWRSFSVQLLFGLDKMDCIIVQSIVRRFLALKTASLRRDSILQIQSAIRSHLTRQAIRRDAKLNVQNRSLRITEEGTMQHQAAREIQNFHRHNPTRTAFLHKNGNAVLIQSLWRAISCKKNFAASKNAVILIQSLMRKCLVAKKFDQRRIHAITIQSLYRRRLRRCKFVRIQARNDLSEREHQLQLRVQLCRSSSEKILSTTCSNHVLTHGCHSINIQRQSVIVIQKYWRMYLARKLYIITFNAVLSVQVNTRRFLAINLYNRRSQVIKVQSICRGWLSRKSLKMDIQATIVLQSFCRFFQARILFRSIRKHLITLQAYCRGYQARNMFLQKFQSAIRLQKCFRGFIARTRYSSFRHAVIAIQAWIRKCLAENDYHRINLRFCHAQSTSRGSLCKQCILWKLMPFHAVVKIQSFYRCRRARCQYKYSIKSAVKIQSIIRRSIASKDLEIQIRSAIAIQKTWRRYSCRQQYLFELMDVVFAQSLIRRYLARQTYIKILNGTKRRSDQNNQCVRTPSEASPSPEDDFFITIGSTSFEGSYLNPGKSCQVPSHTPKLTSSQNVNSVEIEASIIIQKCWRCFTQYLSFAVMKFSAVLIQSVVRKNLIKSKYRVHLNEVCRGNGVGRLLSLTQQQGLIVPREEFDGGILARSNIRDSIHTTGRVQRRQLEITNDIFRLQEIAAKDIQRLWRGYRANVEFMLLVMASVKIQHFVRHWLHRRMQSEINHINAGFSVTKLPNAPQAQPSKSEQNGITGSPIIGLRDFPDFVTFKRPRSDVHRTNSLHEDIGSSESVVAGLVGPPKSLISGRAQVAFDVSSVVGFANRQEVSEVSDVLPLYCNSTSTSSNDRYTKKYGNFNRRIKSKQNVTNTSTHQPQRNNNQGTLTTPDGTRCASRMQRHAEALHILQTSKNLSDVMKSVRILEASTLESFTCCDEFAKADAHHILLSLALTCNRSEPHLELVRLILAILTNVVQHPPIVKSLATTFAADALIDLVQRYRDKSVHFVLSASLLNTILSRDCTLRLNYSTTERRKRLQGILMMCKLKATARVYDNAKMSHTLFSEGIRSLKSVTDLLDSGSR